MEIKDQLKQIPKSPGVYLFYDSKDKIIYIGKSVSLKDRVTSYFRVKNLGSRTSLMVQKITRVDYIKVFSEFEALLLEAELIKKNQPFFNIQAKDDKSPLYIKISSGEIPQITTSRKQKFKKSDFIVGPFQSSKITRSVLKVTRRIFPYCHHKNPQKPCLYVHLGLCPFPYESDVKKQEYKQTIFKIKKFLSGKIGHLVLDLNKEMIEKSKKEKFEEASEYNNQIQSIKKLLETFHDPRDFIEHPNLVDEKNRQRLEDLREKLKLTKIPKRIECYDISNIGGKMATGSMVVFTNGDIDKNQYRKFKIKFLQTPNDYQMIKQVLSRRFRNDWQKPDLILIDGGKGQLNAALSEINRQKLNIPVISLAKKFEEIYSSDRALPMKLPKESPARQLVQALRDEAHRFAISYHRLLRSKNFLGN